MQNWQIGKQRQQQRQVAVSVYYHTVCSIASHVIVLAFNLWGGVCVCVLASLKKKTWVNLTRVMDTQAE